ncbi:MAG: type IV secretory system conjugative DNA transfer family protein [Angelakisella sp.]
MSRKHIFSALIAATLCLLFWLVNRATEAIRLLLSAGMNLVEAMDGTWGKICAAPLGLSLEPIDLGTATAAIMLIVMLAGLRGGRKWRNGEEYGSARYATHKEIAPYIDPKQDNNILLTKTERFTMSSRPSGDYKALNTSLNKNVLVMGGPGSGKTRNFVKPNLMQCHSSYVVTDPKGTVLTECGKLLEEQGYVIRALNINGAQGMKLSKHYNPLAYIRCEADILQLVDVLMVNTNGEGKNSGEKFWQDAERLLYCAYIGYIWQEALPEERNMCMLLNMLENSETREEDEKHMNPVDYLFEWLEKEKPGCFPVRQYRKFKLAPGKTAKNIIISCGARLSPFDINEVRELMAYDELKLDEIGDCKTAFFVITSDTNKTFNFIAAIMYSQMFNLLCDKAIYDYGGRLPVHVRCILDEFANIGRIPNFEEIIAVIRSREISVSVILQSRAQLEGVYEKKADIIVDCCDTMLFLGGKSTKALKEISETMGKETISNTDENKSRGSQKSDSTGTKVMGRELMTPDELASLDSSLCICLIRGLRPFKSKKYDLRSHKRYPRLSDADSSNKYTPTWITLSAPPKPQEEFYYIEMAAQKEKQQYEFERT